MSKINVNRPAPDADGPRSNLAAFLKRATVRDRRATGAGELGAVADEVRALAEAQAKAHAQESRWAKETVARINEAVGDIALAQEASRPGRAGAVREGGGVSYEKTWVDPGVLRAEVESASFPAGEERRLEIEVSSAEQAGLYMYAHYGLKPAPGRSLVIEVAGRSGAHQFTFDSEVDMAEFAREVNRYTSETGVTARKRIEGGPTAIMLLSEAFGDDEFVSIRVIDDGGIPNDRHSGITQVRLDKYDYIHTGDAVSIASASSTVIDEHGQDGTIRFNGQEFHGSGRDTFRVMGDDFVVNVALGSFGPALYPITRLALAIRGSEQSGPIAQAAQDSLPGVEYSAILSQTQITNLELDGATFGAGEVRDIRFNVQSPPEPAGLFLDFRGPSLDLTSAGASYQIKIGGALGAHQYTFASGSTLNTVAATINAFTNVTGVRALVSGNGVVLNSTGYDPSSFVSVEVLDDAGEDARVQHLRWPGEAYSGLFETGKLRMVDFSEPGLITWEGKSIIMDGLEAVFRGPDYSFHLTFDPSNWSELFGRYGVRLVASSAKT